MLALGILLFVTFSGGLPIADGQRLDGVEVVKDGIVSAFIVDVDDHSVALGADAGNDRQAQPWCARWPSVVSAWRLMRFLTHGDRDPTAGVLAFPRAEVNGPRQRRGPGRRARGEVAFQALRVSAPERHQGRAAAPRTAKPFKVGRLGVRVFAVPGHTPGSAPFLARSVLFMGDSARGNQGRQAGRGALATFLKIFP